MHGPRLDDRSSGSTLIEWVILWYAFCHCHVGDWSLSLSRLQVKLRRIAADRLPTRKPNKWLATYVRLNRHRQTFYLLPAAASAIDVTHLTATFWYRREELSSYMKQKSVRSLCASAEKLKRGFHPTQRTQRIERNERNSRKKRKLRAVPLSNWIQVFKV